MSTPIAIESRRPRPGFSLTELLVVIGIIVLLVGLLLVALGSVRTRAKRTQTESIMRAFGQAAESFQIDQGAYPGFIPESAMAGNPNLITSTENALLALMGGARARYLPLDQAGTDTYQAYEDYGSCSDDHIQCMNFSSASWELKVNRNLIGEGPVVNGKPFSPYYTASGREVARSKGQHMGAGDVGDGGAEELPDLVDSWGQPILVLRRLRSVGDLVGDPATAQFTLVGTDGYLKSVALGQMGMPQADGGQVDGLSVFSTDPDPNKAMARLIRHRAFGDTDDPQKGTARGAFVLISAGPDGIFFSRRDGPGSTEDPQDEISDPGDPDVPDAALDEYDDIIIFAGS